METCHKLFVHKYQPLYFNDYGKNHQISKILQSLLAIESLNVLFIGDIASGKTSLLNTLIREYYKDYSPKEFEENVLYINSLKEQGINYYRTDVKTFCQTCSNIKHKKKEFQFYSFIIYHLSNQTTIAQLFKYSYIFFIFKFINTNAIL